MMTLKADDLRSAIIVNWVLNAFLSYTATALNSVTLLALRKSSKTLPKPFEDIASESGCFWSWCWLTGSTFVHSISCHGISARKYWNSNYRDHIQGFHRQYNFFRLCLFLWCCGSSGRQILGCSSSSKISRTCDSQAPCCCGDLGLGVQCHSFHDNGCFPTHSVYCRFHHWNSRWKCLLLIRSPVLYQDLFGRTVPQQTK